MVWSFTLALALMGQTATVPSVDGTPLSHVLLVGGGPDKSHNQAAIESNIRFLTRILPRNDPRRVLFADGDPSDASVQWQDSSGKIHYRIPELAQMDGPAKLPAIQAEISKLAEDSKAHPSEPVFLYFTGHGSPGRRGNYDNNDYDLWGDGALDVRTLAKWLDDFPKETPITLVMVECFSGAFANLLFQAGDPSQPLTDHRICGYFASVPNRMAAGCTPEINEANYRDFTGYFFAALNGTDRVGQPVASADYNRDGRVTLDEAYNYALSHDDSIDTPMCTSDLFLRHFVKVSDEAVLSTPYADLLRWATPAQRAALSQLSVRLGYKSEDRLRKSYEEVERNDPQTENSIQVQTLRFERLGRTVALAHYLQASRDASTLLRYRELVKLESSSLL